MTQTNAQVALLAAVQSINQGDIWQGRDSVKSEIEKRRVEYLEWLNSQGVVVNKSPQKIDFGSSSINVKKIIGLDY